jgi:hypothetical protein
MTRQYSQRDETTEDHDSKTAAIIWQRIRLRLWLLGLLSKLGRFSRR